MNEYFNNKLQSVYKGYEVWDSRFVVSGYGLNDAALILTPDELECHYYSLLYLKDFMRIKKKNKLYIAFSDKRYINVLSDFYEDANLLNLNENQIYELICYLSLFDCGGSVLISSTLLPEGRNAQRQIEKGYFSMEYYAVTGILRLSDTLETEKPKRFCNASKFTAFIEEGA